PRLRLALPHDGHVWHLLHLGIPDPVVAGLAALVQVGADTGRPQLRLHPARRPQLVVADREHAHLLGREPQRERAREVLDEEAAEPLQRAVDRAVDHHGPVRPVVRARVLELKPLRQLVVELDGGALPLAPDRVVELDVDLRAVEGPAALVDAIPDAAPLAPARSLRYTFATSASRTGRSR